jgi:hypothetical protein
MRTSHSTLTPAAVRALARDALAAALPWRPVGRRATVKRLLDLLLLAAALRASLSAVARRFRFGFSHETARRAAYANLPALGPLREGLADALHAFGGRAWRRRRWDIAIDLHYRPFYGDRTAPGVVGGPKKQGTKHFYGYATAVLLHRGRRYTVGLTALEPGAKPHAVVAALLDQVAARGLRLRGVVLDSGFDSGEVLLLLQRRRLAYTVPLRRKGRGDNRRNACFALPPGARLAVDWVTEASRRRVRTRAVVGRRPRPDGRPQVYAYGGWLPGRAVSAARRAAQAERAYRRRFGIETSYRQLNAGRAATTAKGVAYRLLLVGLALLLRQAWVYLTGELGRARGAGPGAWVAELPLGRLLDWLREALARRYKEGRSIEFGQPLLDPFASCQP